jgi:hypothetical protein
LPNGRLIVSFKVEFNCETKSATSEEWELPIVVGFDSAVGTTQCIKVFKRKCGRNLAELIKTVAAQCEKKNG